MRCRIGEPFVVRHDAVELITDVERRSQVDGVERSLHRRIEAPRPARLAGSQSRSRRPPASRAPRCRGSTPRPLEPSTARRHARRAARSTTPVPARAAACRPTINAGTRVRAIGTNCGTGLPCSVMVTDSPAAAAATTADAFCLSARIPTSVMCHAVAQCRPPGMGPWAHRSPVEPSGACRSRTLVAVHQLGRRFTEVSVCQWRSSPVSAVRTART